MKMPPIVLDRILDEYRLETLCNLADCGSLDCTECALNNHINNEIYLKETNNENRD